MMHDSRWSARICSIDTLMRFARRVCVERNSPPHQINPMIREFFRRLFQRTPQPHRTIIWTDGRPLPPGEVFVLHDKNNREQYVLMQVDDFDHILALSNLKRESIPGTRVAVK